MIGSRGARDLLRHIYKRQNSIYNLSEWEGVRGANWGEVRLHLALTLTKSTYIHVSVYIHVNPCECVNVILT